MSKNRNSRLWAALLPALCALCVPLKGQSLDSALAFYPLNVGDEWQFDFVHHPSGYVKGYIDYRVVGDSLMPNGKVYRLVTRKESSPLTPNYSLPGWFGGFRRVDSLSANVYQYDASRPSGETLVDSLLARPGDHFSYMNHPYLGFCSSEGDAAILGNPTVIKSYGISVTQRYTLAYGFGLVYVWLVEVDEFPSMIALVYAKIGGQTYGTRVSVGDQYLATTTEFQLEQNFPNPFNPSTTIRYGVPMRSHVSLAVINTLGQQVAELFNGDVEAGYHEVRFDASGLSSGVYFYRMQAGAYTKTERLILVQ